MSEALTGRAVTKPIPGNTGIHKSRDADVNLRFTGLSSVNDRALAFGSAASTPATFAGLHGSVQAPVTDWGPMSLGYTAGGGWTATVSTELSSGQLTAMTDGEYLYACLFAVDPAISGSVPNLVIQLPIVQGD